MGDVIIIDKYNRISISRPMEEAMDNETRSQKRTLIILIVAVVVVILIGLTLAYCVMASHHKGRFPDKTYINGVDVSGMTAQRAKNELADEVENYTLTIEERGGTTETISGEEIGLTYVDNGDVDRLLSKYNPYKWFFDQFRTDELTAATDSTSDSAKAEQAVRGLSCFRNYTPVQNAGIVDNGTEFVVQEAVEGNQLNTEAAVSAILTAINTGESTINLEAQGLYLAPEAVDTAALQVTADQLNGYLKANLTFDFGDDRIVKIDASVIRTWIAADENGNMDLNYDLVFNFVKTRMAYKVDTFGLKHTITTHNGTKITLPGGDYGWCMARGDTTDEIIEAVKAGETKNMEAKWQYKAKNMGIDDIGGTYVEVSISDQMMWCYKDGQCIVETPVVTGNPNREGSATPYGSVWAIDAKKRNATLGTIDTMGYSSPVNYWMPFNGNVGIHDADGWRSEYGGQIYLTRGSHGCINTPEDQVAKIYDAVEIGTAVIVYNLDDPNTEIVSRPGEYAPVQNDSNWDWDD